MKCASGVLAIFAAASLLLGYPADKKSTNHPPDPKGSPRADLDEATSKLAAQFPRLGGPPIGPIPRNNYIDDYIFGKMERDNIPHAQLSSDEEFLRRVFLGLTGRLPEPDRVRSFVEESDPDKRYKLIDELTDAKVDPGGGVILLFHTWIAGPISFLTCFGTHRLSWVSREEICFGITSIRRSF